MYVLKTLGMLLLGLLVTGFAGAQETSQALFTVNNLWMMVSTFLVFIMHLGFASVETGLTRAKKRCEYFV